MERAVKAVYDSYLDRYIIIDDNTGEVLDDAQGYGFRNKRGAYACYYYKLKNRKQEEEE